MLNYLIVFLVSMLPIVELRGAIPVGAAMGLDIVPVVLISVIGNILPVPFLILFGGKVLRYFASFEKFGKPFRKILEMGESKVQKMKKTLFIGLLTFVAIPLPGTGAWTGSLIAITLSLDMKRSFPPIALGVVIAGAIMTTLSYLAPEVFKMLVS